MDGELISIIIPIYNAENYLLRCVDSILEQSYQNLQIILVDDGSTDDSSSICDHYSEKDSRINVIHKRNEGVARARNCGTLHAKGAYIAFIDADDFVNKFYVETLLCVLKQENSDMVVCGMKTFYESKKKYINFSENIRKPTIKVYTGERALEMLLYRKKITSSPWAKMIRRELVENNPFPEGILFEDLGVVYKWIANSKKVVYCECPFYYYLIRKGSRQHSVFDIKKWDLIEISKEIVEYVEAYYPRCLKSAKSRLFVSCLQILRDIPRKEFAEEFCMLRDEIKNLRKDILVDSRAKKSTRLLALICCLVDIRIIQDAGRFCDKIMYLLKMKTF